MCARVAQLILAALFVFVVVTVAAFVYLEWWQAILASLVTFLLMVFAAKLLIKTALGRLGDLAKEMFRTKSRVLAGATIEVHSVRATEMPTEVAEQLKEEAEFEDEDEEAEAKKYREDVEAQLRDSSWYEVELTIIPKPDPSGPMDHWDIDDLRLVPADAPEEDPFADDESDDDDESEEFPLYEVRVIYAGQARELEESKFVGPNRIRFIVGCPRTISELKFRYYFEHFGRIRLAPRALR